MKKYLLFIKEGISTFIFIWVGYCAVYGTIDLLSSQLLKINLERYFISLHQFVIVDVIITIWLLFFIKKTDSFIKKRDHIAKYFIVIILVFVLIFLIISLIHWKISYFSFVAAMGIAAFFTLVTVLLEKS